MTIPRRTRSKRSPGRPAGALDYDARDLLLSAATDLFAAQGVAATSFSLIAKRAGLTPAMMHYYFKDREQLLDCVVEERLATLIASVWDPVQPGTEPAAVVGGIVERMLAGIERMPWVPSTWMREVLNEGGLLRSRVLRHLPFEKVRVLSEAIAKGKSEGTINMEIDPVLIVFSMIGLVMMHLATARFFAEVFHREAPSKDAMRRHITGLLLHGLQPPSSGGKKRKGRKQEGGDGAR
jgi:TetR/AcrR family transcriptional regulator